MSEITKGILTQAVKDYSKAVEYCKVNKFDFQSHVKWLEERGLDSGLCRYFAFNHKVTLENLDIVRPKNGTRRSAWWWYTPNVSEIKTEFLETLTVRLNFLKTKLAEMENQN